MRSPSAPAAFSAFSAALVGFSSLASAKPQSYCPTDNVCYQVAVPETSASSDSGPIYFQLSAPTTYSWVAMGQGNQMSGANIFVMYTDGSGNVTVSPRAGEGHVMPKHDASVKVNLLEGSGVVDNGQTMLANVKCSNCQSWQNGAGQMSLTSTSAPFIAAWKSGSSLDSSDVSESIDYHDSHGNWQLDLTKSTVSTASNPFVDASGDSTNTGSDSGSDSGAVSGGDSDMGGSYEMVNTMVMAHGIIMAIVMLILYPLGSALMPLFGKWMVHAAWQGVSFILMWVGFALGYVAAGKLAIDFESTHTLFGTVLVALFGLQPVLGYLHHMHFVKNRSRGPVSYAHIWYGRALMLMGVINGGLGLQLATASSSFITAYSIVAAVIFVIYGLAKGFGVVKKRKQQRDGANMELKNRSSA